MFDVLTIKASRGVFLYQPGLPDLAEATAASSAAYLVAKSLQPSGLVLSGVAFLVVHQRDSADLRAGGCVRPNDPRVLHQCGSF